MNRTDRLLAIILELQAKGWQRAEDLARTFEISKRTAYRDLMALSESGIPIITQPGRGYSLDKDYFLPPLHFTPEEAVVLLLGADTMAQNFDADYQQAAGDAARKIEVILGSARREQVSQLRDSLRFVSTSTAGSSQTDAVLRKARRAILQRCVIRIQYVARFGDTAGAVSQRDVDPYALVHYANAWYLVAYDHNRRKIRHFRLERIQTLDVLAQRFLRAPQTAIFAENTADRQIFVQVIFEPSIARWAKEEANYYQVKAEDIDAGYLVTLCVRAEAEILQWLLSWGGKVRVVAPDSLKQLLIHEAQAILKQYEDLLP